MPVERAAGGSSLIDVLDRVLDKGIVIDAWVRVSLVGIDLITVEARIVVASIDTYLKYSEAVGQVAPVSKPAIEGRGYEEVIAENASLRAQLKASSGSGRAAVRRRRSPTRGLRATGRGCSGVAQTAAAAVGDDQLLAARVRLLEAFVSRSDVTDCTQYALQWLREILGLTPSLCLLRPAGEDALFTVGAHGLPGTAIVSFYRVARGLEQSARHGLQQPRTRLFPCRAFRRRPQTPSVDAVRGRGVSRRSAVRRRTEPRRLRTAPDRRQRAAAARNCGGSRRSSRRSWRRSFVSRR